MAGADISALNDFGTLMDLFSEDKEVQDHIQSSMYGFIRRASPGEVDYDGKVFKQAVQYQQNETYNAINDGEPIGVSDMTKGVFAEYKPKLMYAPMEATNFALTRGRSGGRSGGKYAEELTKSTLLTFISGVNFDLYGNGRGKRAVVNTATAAASSFTVDSSMRLRPGMRLDWYNSALTTLRGSIKVGDRGVDRMSRTVYIDPAFGTGAVPAGAASDDVLVVYGALAAGEPTDGRYIAGFERICDNSLTFGNLSPATYAWWQATNINAAGGNITQMLLQLHVDSIYQVSGQYPNKMAFNTAQKRAYLQNLLNNRMFSSNNFDTGAASLSWDYLKWGQDQKNKKPSQFQMLEDKDADLDRFLIWCDSCFYLASDNDEEPTIAADDGQEWRMRQGYDTMSAFHRYWGNTGTKKRNGVGMIYGLNVPEGAL